MKGRQIAFFIIVLSVLAAAGSTYRERGEGKETQVRVFLAASLSNAMEEIKEVYEEQNPGVKLVYNSDSSGTLKAQIEEGAACDLFFSAAYSQMEELEQEGYVESDTVTRVLYNQVVLIKPYGQQTRMTGFEDIIKADSLALAGEEVPVGAYAREIFESLGILDEVLEMEINESPNVTAVLGAVSEGANEAGVVYATDAASAADKVEIIAYAPEGSLKTPVAYPAALIKNEGADRKEQKEAGKLLRWLSSDASQAIFEKYGFATTEP